MEGLCVSYIPQKKPLCYCLVNETQKMLKWTCEWIIGKINQEIFFCYYTLHALAMSETLEKVEDVTNWLMGELPVNMVTSEHGY